MKVTGRLLLFSLVFVSIICMWRLLVAHFQVKTIHDVARLFPTGVAEVVQREENAKKHVLESIAQIIAVSAHERNFDNTLKALDGAGAILGHEASIFQALFHTHPDPELREAAFAAVSRLTDFAVEHLEYNIELYCAVRDYVEGPGATENLSPERRYYAQETLRGYKKNGLNRSPEEQDRIALLKKELFKYEQEFERAIASDDRSITVQEDSLTGLTSEFIAGLKRTDDGLYILGVDYPTYFVVMEHCCVGSTREALWREFMNRAYPQNIETLKNIMRLRSELARSLGYASYAHYDIDNEMAQSPEVVDRFLTQVSARAAIKLAEEITRYLAVLPEEVTLTADGKIKPWDWGFIKGQYRKKHFNFDDRVIAEYFPLEHTINELLRLYEEFLGVRFERVAGVDFYHSDVKAIKVTTSDNELIGFLLLDLFPRPDKFTHACFMSLEHSLRTADGMLRPGVGLVIANFTQPTSDRPSLLKHNEVTTFFHEFGHAIHGLLGATELESFSGTNVKRDFVELPSQMLEEWMWDKDIIRRVSKHYLTGNVMPDELLDTMISLKNIDSGGFIQRQAILARTSLVFFSEPVVQDTSIVTQALWTSLFPAMATVDEDHFEASFGHLTGYASKYYGYLWSKVFALDLFDYIKKHGLLNREIGQRYAQIVLAKGGSRPPQELLHEFLGREPNADAFFKDLGL